MSVSTVLRQGNMVFNTDRGKSHSDIVIYDRVRTIYSLPLQYSVIVKNTVTTSSDIPPPPLFFVD